jgi:hypothetical protein
MLEQLKEACARLGDKSSIFLCKCALLTSAAESALVFVKGMCAALFWVHLFHRFFDAMIQTLKVTTPPASNRSCAPNCALPCKRFVRLCSRRTGSKPRNLSPKQRPRATHHISTQSMRPLRLLPVRRLRIGRRTACSKSNGPSRLLPFVACLCLHHL